MLFRSNEVIEPEDFDAISQQDEIDQLTTPEPHEKFDLKAYLNKIRHKLYRKALDRTDGNKSKAARLLGVTPPAVDRYLEGKKKTKP